MNPPIKSRIHSRWKLCHARGVLDNLSLARRSYRARRAEQLARAAWYFVVGVG